MNNMDQRSFSKIYFDLAASLPEIKLLIIGQAPYPDGANGVAFCKDTHVEFFDASCCGNLLMSSMGLTEDYIKLNFISPKELFIYLLQKEQICFININNKAFTKSSETDKRNVLLTKALNLKYVAKAKHILLLGIGHTKFNFQNYYSEFDFEMAIIHPSLSAKDIDPTSQKRKQWDKAWGSNFIEREILNKINIVLKK